MNVWSKLNTLVRGQMRESAEQLIDRHSLRIFEQEIIDCEQALHAAKYHLGTLMAEKIRLQREHKAHLDKRNQREQQARAALAASDEALALEVAEVIAELDRYIGQEEAQLAKLEQQEADLKKRLRETAKTIADYRRELGLLKATAHAQQASGMLSGHATSINDRVYAMRDSLERIRAKQQAWDDRDAALTEMANDDGQTSLDDKLRAAGIACAPLDAQKILERLRQPQA